VSANAPQCRRIGGKAPELPIESNLTEASGTDELIAGDIVDLERAGVGVAQHEIGRAGGVHRRDARGAGELVVGDVVDFLAGNPAEIADT